MKTWEMIKELTENPKKKFKVKNGARQIEICNNNLINSYSMANYIITAENLSWEWEEVKEPVSFIEAIRSGKRIMVKHQDIDEELEYMSKSYNDLSDVLYDISSYFTNNGVKDIILNGKWYIED